MSTIFKRFLRVVAAGAIATTTLSMIAQQAPGAPATRSARLKIARGIVYHKIVLPGPPQNILYVLTLTPGPKVTLDTALASPTLSGYATTSSMVAAHGAIAGINGDFGFYPGEPAHAFAEDGDLKQTTMIGNAGKNFAISKDFHSHIDTPNTDINLRRVSSGVTFPINMVNQTPIASDEVGEFTAAGGFPAATPPKNACNARLLPTSAPPAWGPSGNGVVRTYTVDYIYCGINPPPLSGGVLLSTPSTGSRANDIKNLTLHETVDLSWSFGWPNVLDAVGGSPILVQGGQVTADPACTTYLCQIQPRTAIGVTSTGKVLLVVLDGRQTKSAGMTMFDWATEMKALGAVDAINLDGGGSSTLVANGVVKNSPSDGTQRPVTNAVVVLTGPDPGEPTSLRTRRAPAGTQTVAPAAASQAAADALGDPGSTGGLLNHLGP